MPISAPLGVAAFVGFLLLAVQLLVHAYATATVTAAAYDAARSASSARPVGTALPRNAIGEAEERARWLLGRYGDRARFDWSGSGEDSVVLRVRVPGPHVLPVALAERAGLADVDRTVRVRVERLQ